MTQPSRTPERGRPPLVTPKRIAEAVLEIKGHEPTLAELAAHLGVARATLYTHLRGQDALRRFAQNALLERWELDPLVEGTHWAAWARDFGWEIRAKLIDYPYLIDVMPDARTGFPGQVMLTERVMARLVALGLEPSDAFLLLRCLMVLVVGLHAQRWGNPAHESDAAALFVDWASAHPMPLPVLGRFLESPTFVSGDGICEEKLDHLLTGFAARRGESLPDGFGFGKRA